MFVFDEELGLLLERTERWVSTSLACVIRVC